MAKFGVLVSDMMNLIIHNSERGQSERIHRFGGLGSPSSQGFGWHSKLDRSPPAQKLLIPFPSAADIVRSVYCSLPADSRRARFCPEMRQSGTGMAYYGYRYYDPQTGRWPSRDPIEEAGGLNLYGFIGNEGVNDVDVLGLVSIAFEGGGGVGLGGWGSATVDFEMGGTCSDGTKCWKATLDISGNVGVILGGKVKVLGLGVDLSIVGPHLSRKQTVTVERDCSGFNASNKFDLIRTNWDFNVSSTFDVFHLTIGANFNGGVSFGLFVEANVNANGVNVAIKGDVDPYGSYTIGASKKGKRGQTIPVGPSLAGDFDTEEGKEKVFFEEYFGLP